VRRGIHAEFVANHAPGSDDADETIMTESGISNNQYTKVENAARLPNP
jgi:hypothetical protein